jgi:hypothetical protein
VSNRYGNYGVLILNSDSGWTGSARRFMITNGIGSNKFGIIRSVDANTDPALGDGGSIASGTVDFEINNAGAATFSSSLTAGVGSFTGTSAQALTIHKTSGGGSQLLMSTTFGNTYGISPFIAGVSNGGFSITDVTNNAQRIVIQDGTGNVGIGTTSPSVKLDVNGKIYSSTEVQANNAVINTTGGYATFGSNSSVVGVRVGRDASLNDIIINPSGNVTIGSTTDAGFKLDVNGTGRFNSTSSTPFLINTNTDNTTTIRTSNGGGNSLMSFENSGDANNAFAIGRSNSGDFVLNHSASSVYGGGTLTNYLNISSTGAATFSSSVTGQQGVNIGANALGTDRMFQVSGTAFTSGANQFASVINPTMGTLTTLFGLYLGINCTSATTGYGIYLEGSGGSITNRWGIYQSSSSDRNYFAGNVLIGTATTPTPVSGVAFPLTVSSSAATRIRIDSTNASPNSGVGLYANGVQKFSFAMYGATSDFTIYNDALLAPSLTVKGTNSNVLIGTTDDNGSKLRVAGGIGFFDSGIKTGTLDTGYVAGTWKLGRAVIGTQPSETHQIIVEINGALFTIGAAAL